MGGPRLIAASTACILTACLGTLAVLGVGQEGLRGVIRLTARTSLLLFLLAFAASAAYRLRPGPGTRWLLANRRYVGLSFAASHLVHLLAIVALATRVPDDFSSHTQASTIVVGGIGYVFVALMAATSNDASVAWLGRRRWRLLHLVGAYWLWQVFLISYLARAITAPANVVPLALVLGAWALRIAARRRRAVVTQAI
jgi:DMSO/TMAO reductase YedYZ heme-binding membrane subunit